MKLFVLRTNAAGGAGFPDIFMQFSVPTTQGHWGVESVLK
jgi:hypothetical protein